MPLSLPVSLISGQRLLFTDTQGSISEPDEGSRPSNVLHEVLVTSGFHR